MENRKKERTVARRLFTKTANELEAAMFQESKSALISKFNILKEIAENLFKLDKQIKEVLLADFQEDELEREMSQAYEYKERWLHIEAEFKTILTQSSPQGEVFSPARSFKLPTLELQSFDGELKGWLPFWGQFSKIDADPNLHDTEKYQYLVQAMKIGSEPRRLVEGFPATAYRQCIEQLKGRYAREDLLTQIYIREILSLVLVDKKDNLTKLYDQLTAHLRALETLKVTTKNYAAFLLPMVESALPRETLRIWERNRDPGKDVANLLQFLRKEVESEQRLKISKKTFKVEEDHPSTSTAECLVANVKSKTNKKSEDNTAKSSCIWCDKGTHSSIECYRLNTLDMEQRMALLKEKKACTICLRKGHRTKICRASTKCLICTKRHSTVLCPELKLQPINDMANKMAALASTDHNGETLLQTIIVEVEYGGRKEKIRALLDSGSQRTYIKQEVVEKIKIPPVRKEVLTHTLFGGVETKAKQFEVYDFYINAIN